MPRRREVVHLLVSLAAVAALVALLRRLGVSNATTVALSLLVVVLSTATASRLWVAVVCSIVSMLALNFFFMPPVGTFTIIDPQNWVALLVFLIVGFVASKLSAAAQARAQDAIARRNELGHLFDLSRDVLLTTERQDTLDVLATYISRRFELTSVALCLPSAEGRWLQRQGGPQEVLLEDSQLEAALARAGAAFDVDARERTCGGSSVVETASGRVVLVPLRSGTKAIGLLAAPEGRLERGPLDAIAGLAAIAVERTQLLAERKDVELIRQKVALASTLLASLSHDLRTPLTAINVAVENLQKPQLLPAERQEQGRVALVELERLRRLFRDILDMARIDASALSVDRDWVTPADVIDAAISYLRPTLEDRALEIDADSSTVVFVDPRLTSAALSHLIENAAQYSATGQPIEICGWVNGDGLQLMVRDHGPGLDPTELDHLFERFFRGRNAQTKTLGTGMGLAITRGLLAAEEGRVRGENAAGGGAQFTLFVPGGSHAALTAQDV